VWTRILQLLLIPTDFELDWIPTSLKDEWLQRGHRIDICGFGICLSGIRTMQILASLDVERVILLGIAGFFVDASSLGKAIRFARVAVHGIGVGEGCDHRSASELGWFQWPREPRIGDSLDLDYSDTSQDGPLLLSVASASKDTDEASVRHSKFRDAVAEDMEGFAVAAACRLRGIPCEIIRGISNRAGDREHRNWQVREALSSAMTMALTI